MLAEGVRKIAGVADSNAELDLEQLERYITLELAVQLKVQKFLRDRKLSTVFVPNGRCAKGLVAIVARVIIARLTPPGFRDDVRNATRLSR